MAEELKDDGPTSLKFRDRLEGLKLVGIPMMTTSIIAKSCAFAFPNA